MENPNHPQKHHHQPTNTTTTFTSLPTELQHNIFSRLPSKPLHISKCVSKQWLSIIKSQEFTHYFHKLHSLSSPNSNRLLVFDSLRYVSSVELDNYSNTHNANEPIISKHNTITLPEDCMCRLVVVGTCNGLVCLSEKSYDTIKERDTIKKRLFVYNPFTRRLWTVPVPVSAFVDSDPGHCLYGFGYDSATNDYKIMRFPGLPRGVVETPTRRGAYLFSLRSWSWKRVDDFPYEISVLAHQYSRPCLFMDGHLHWIVVLDNGNSRRGSISIGIARFDLSSEKYSLMELPQVLSNVPQNCTSYEGPGKGLGYSLVEVFEGKLSLQVMHYGRDGNHEFDVWVMEEYGISESWKRLFRIGHSSGKFFDLVGMKVMAYSTCRDRILVVRDLDLYWYDTEGKVLELAWGHGLRDGIHVSFSASIVCDGTLISPYCGDEECQLG